MQISSRFTIAVHMMTCMETFKEDDKITSDFLASSIHVNPVIIRRLLSQLKEAGLIGVKRGTGGAAAIEPLDEITFLDIYRAVECMGDNTLFHFHENPDPQCPVGRNIHNLLDGRLKRVQEAMERELKSITMADVMEDMGKYQWCQNYASGGFPVEGEV